MATPVLSVVVLAWDQAELTSRCIASVRANTDVPYELIVVDNGSAEKGVEVARSGADVAILNDENRGFAAGMNQGLAAATGDHVAFVNNDTELPVRWASRLIETFGDHPDAGLVLPAVTTAGNPFSVRTEPGERRLVVPRFREIPSGVVYVLPRSYAAELGGWSEEYPVASSEDLDLLFTVWCTGRAVVLDERVLVRHVGSATVSAKLPDRDRLWKGNRHAFAAKWMAMTSDGVPGVAGVDPDTVARRVAEATIAATWMERTFRAREEAGAMRGAAAAADRAPATPGAVGTAVGQLWNRCRRLVPSGLRTRLFPFVRSWYYRVFPGGRTNGPPGM